MSHWISRMSVSQRDFLGKSETVQQWQPHNSLPLSFTLPSLHLDKRLKKEASTQSDEYRGREGGRREIGGERELASVKEGGETR